LDAIVDFSDLFKLTRISLLSQGCMSAIACVVAVSGPVVFAIDAMTGVLSWLRLNCAIVERVKNP